MILPRNGGLFRPFSLRFQGPASAMAEGVRHHKSSPRHRRPVERYQIFAAIRVALTKMVA